MSGMLYLSIYIYIHICGNTSVAEEAMSGAEAALRAEIPLESESPRLVRFSLDIYIYIYIYVYIDIYVRKTALLSRPRGMRLPYGQNYS